MGGNSRNNVLRLEIYLRYIHVAVKYIGLIWNSSPAYIYDISKVFLVNILFCII